MSENQEPRDARERAAKSAGRAAGYCWVEHPAEPLHCTRWPNHRGRPHKHYYTGTEWE
ncbi:hypothetical protein ABT186_02330 [Streptomyces sp. NPDC001634]|uniref:hypothetical protein n=1 Tax=Streptomyces sp. NPDC001634 TaxID=3154390 RepID=UPI00331D2A6F